jgi:hypothetical protein
MPGADILAGVGWRQFRDGEFAIRHGPCALAAILCRQVIAHSGFGAKHSVPVKRLLPQRRVLLRSPARGSNAEHHLRAAVQLDILLGA